MVRYIRCLPEAGDKSSIMNIDCYTHIHILPHLHFLDPFPDIPKALSSLF